MFIFPSSNGELKVITINIETNSDAAEKNIRALSKRFQTHGGLRRDHDGEGFRTLLRAPVFPFFTGSFENSTDVES